MRYGEIRGRTEDLQAFAEPVPLPEPQPAHRVNLDPEKLEQGLTQLVLSLVEFVRRLLEKQALRRIEGGSLSERQVDRLGVTLMRLEEQMEQLKDHFGIENLNLDLGPLGSLWDE